MCVCVLKCMRKYFCKKLLAHVNIKKYTLKTNLSLYYNLYFVDDLII
jgi:hypothetical protein